MKTLPFIALMLASTTAFSATTGNLIVKGSVPQLLSIEVTPQPVATTLPLDISQQDTQVAQIKEKSNSASGYKVTVESANTGKLKRSGGNEVFAYNLKYGGQALNLATSVVLTNPASAAVSATKSLTISYTGIPAEEMVSGEYVDTLTFTIAPN